MPELYSAHLPTPLPLNIIQWTLKDDCPLSVLFTLFGCFFLWWRGGAVPRGQRHNLLMQFSSLCGSQMECSEGYPVYIPTIRNDQISYVKHVLHRIHMVFTLFGCLDGGKGWGTTCLGNCPLSAAQKWKFSKLIFFYVLSIHNYQISYANHADPLCVFCKVAGPSSRGLHGPHPQGGPPGPLNTRPLTGLSMVYRLWAGVRMVDAIAWQDSYAHPAAFGFRPARSALDGAAVTQVLLELCRLRGWAVAGMSLDYVKCFDLIPQAVVLALAVELGMDPGTCPRGHVQAAPHGLQDRRGPRPVVAGHQRHRAEAPPVGDCGECTHHDLEMGGGLPTPAGVRSDGRPPRRSG